MNKATRPPDYAKWPRPDQDKWLAENNPRLARVLHLPVDRRPKRDWLSACIADERDRPLSVLANVLVALRGAPGIENCFAFDEMQRAAVVLRELPVAPGGEPVAGLVPRPVRDMDVSQLQEWLQWQGQPKIGRDIVFQGVDQRAGERAFHPVRDCLERLKWDGRLRVDNWFVTDLGAADSAYTHGIAGAARNRPRSASARASMPGGDRQRRNDLQGPFRRHQASFPNCCRTGRALRLPGGGEKPQSRYRGSERMTKPIRPRRRQGWRGN